MSISETITKNDLTNILNEVLLSPNYGGIYKASWTASSSSANGTQLTENLIIPAGTYVINCISPVASVDFSLAIAGRYKEMNKSGDSFTIIYSCDGEVTFHVSSAQSAAVTFSYTDRGSLTAIQISQQSVASNVTDYIVEQGTDGIWTYRKWNSGLLECWGFTSVASNTYSANGGSKQVAEATPSLFNGAPTNVQASGYISTLIRTSIGYTYANSSWVQTYLINDNTSSVTADGGVYWELKGTWK